MIRTPLEHTHLLIEGIELHVVQAGPADGIPVILLHGFPEYWYSWRHQIDPLVEAGYRLYIPDQRGYNLSDKPADVAAYNLDRVAGDIIGLADHIGVEKVRVVGHEWGGAAAWWAANKYPERVEKLTILNVPHHAAFGKAVAENPVQRRKSLYMAFFQLKGIAEFAIRFNKGALLARWAFRDNPNFTKEDIQHYKVAWAQQGATTGMMNWYRAVRQHRPERLSSPRIQVPTLLIWGKRDFAFITELAQASIDLCDDGRVAYIDHATHWIQHDAPDEVNRLLLEWLK